MKPKKQLNNLHFFHKMTDKAWNWGNLWPIKWQIRLVMSNDWVLFRPLERVPSNPSLKIEVLSSPPFLKFGYRYNLPRRNSRGAGGAHYVNDIMNLNFSSFNTLVTVTPYCVFYAIRHQIYSRFGTDGMVFASALIWCHAHRQTHTGYRGTNTNINIY